MFSIHLLLRLYINIYIYIYEEIKRKTKQNTDATVKGHLTFVFCLYETIKAKIITD